MRFRHLLTLTTTALALGILASTAHAEAGVAANQAAGAHFTLANGPAEKTSVFVAANCPSLCNSDYGVNPMTAQVGVFQSTCDTATDEWVVQSFVAEAGQITGRGFFYDKGIDQKGSYSQDIDDPPLQLVGSERRQPNCAHPDPTGEHTVALGTFPVPVLRVEWYSEHPLQVGKGLDQSIGALGCMEVAAEAAIYRKAAVWELTRSAYTRGWIDARALPLLHPIGFPYSALFADDASIAYQAGAFAFTHDPTCM